MNFVNELWNKDGNVLVFSLVPSRPKMHLCCAGCRSINQETFLHNKYNLEAYDAGLTTGDLNELVLKQFMKFFGWLRIPLWLDCGFDREDLKKLLVEAEYDLKNYADRG